MAPTFSRTLLSREQGLAEADDAIAKTAAQGFPTGGVKHPTDVGFEFASAWQGILDTNQTWSGVTIHIDVDIADSRSPSAP